MGDIHFIAIGGAIMHQLALALHRQGHQITGSDDEINEPARSNLEVAGLLPPSMGWYPEKINASLDSVVLGMHARLDNPELLQAQSLNLPIYSFPQLVHGVSKDKKRVVVAGSHGKTTITAMIMHLLKSCDLRFDYLVGARVPGFQTSVKLSDDPLIIIEGDEYPASAVEPHPKILFYKPQITVLSGIAWDHINVFPTREVYVKQFRLFMQQLTDGAIVIYNQDDSTVVALIAEMRTRLHCIPYSMPTFDYVQGVLTVVTVDGERVPLSIIGRHNVQNMAAAVAVAETLGIGSKEAWASAASFIGAARRLEKLIEKPELIVYRDFAHAPSKLKATLDAVREAWPQHLLIAVFELHTYSSLNAAFLNEYEGSMHAADQAVVFFSKHTLALKGLPKLEKNRVTDAFLAENMLVFDEATELFAHVQGVLRAAGAPVCLLLMSSGAFDGIDWKLLSSPE